MSDRARSFDKDRTIGLLEKKGKEDLDKIDALKKALKHAIVPVTENPPGSRTLAECESIIDAGMRAHVEAWLALKEIHDRKLYRPKYDDFKSYCIGRWGYRMEGYRYLQAANVSQLLLHDGMPVPPTSAHARVLAPLLGEPEKLKEAWDLALQLNDGHPTFLEVRDIVAGFLPPPSPRGDNSGGDAAVADNSGLNSSPSELPQPIQPEGESGSDGVPAKMISVQPELGEGLTEVSQPLESHVPESLPSGYWEKDEVLRWHGKINGAVRSAAHYMDDPAIRTWMEALYEFVKGALGYSK